MAALGGALMEDAEGALELRELSFAGRLRRLEGSKGY